MELATVCCALTVERSAIVGTLFVEAGARFDALRRAALYITSQTTSEPSGRRKRLSKVGARFYSRPEATAPSTRRSSGATVDSSNLESTIGMLSNRHSNR